MSSFLGGLTHTVFKEPRQEINKAAQWLIDRVMFSFLNIAAITHISLKQKEIYLNVNSSR